MNVEREQARAHKFAIISMALIHVHACQALDLLMDRVEFAKL